MRQWLRSHLTYANVMATIAVFFVLGGGTAFAAYVVSSNGQIGPGTVSGHSPPSGDHPNVVGGSINRFDLAPAAGRVYSNRLSVPAGTSGQIELRVPQFGELRLQQCDSSHGAGLYWLNTTNRSEETNYGNHNSYKLVAPNRAYGGVGEYSTPLQISSGTGTSTAIASIVATARIIDGGARCSLVAQAIAQAP